MSFRECTSFGARSWTKRQMSNTLAFLSVVAGTYDYNLIWTLLLASKKAKIVRHNERY